jgi:hypothetical protein
MLSAKYLRYIPLDFMTDYSCKYRDERLECSFIQSQN